MMRRLLYIFAVFSIFALPMGCASDNDSPDENTSGEVATVHFSIRALPSNLATRADGTPHDPIHDSERINDWWIVFTDATTGKVAKGIYRQKSAEYTYPENTYPATFTAAKNSGGAAAIEEETFECELPAGTYSVFAFANITPAQVWAATGVDFTGKSIPMTDNGDVISWLNLGWKNDADGNTEVKDPVTDSNGNIIYVRDTNGEIKNDADGKPISISADLPYNAKASTVGNGNLNLWNAGSGSWNGDNVQYSFNNNTAVNLPMSGYLKDVKVANNMEEAFSIEVVRMLAKMEFEFVNTTEKEITILEVSVDPVTTAPVKVFPIYDILGVSSYAKSEAWKGFFDKYLQGDNYGKLKYQIGTKDDNDKYTGEGGVSVAAATSTGEGDAKVTTNGKQNIFFYMKESISDRPNDGKFTIGVKYKRDDSGIVEESRYAITSDIAEYINRNDWIYIPITFTDYVVEFDVLFYPPIGGYPPMVVDEQSDPRSSYVTFSTPGEFAIYPKVRKSGPITEGSYLPMEEILYTNPTANKKPNMTVQVKSDTSDILKKLSSGSKYKIDYTDGAILGEFVGPTAEKPDSHEGTAILKVSVGVKGNTYTRNIYLIRADKKSE